MKRLMSILFCIAVLIPALLPNPGTGGDADAHVRDDETIITPKFVLPRQAPLEDMIRYASLEIGAGLSGDERCLAQAVYFEARSEPLEGQLAVAQVVLNRVESKRYPNTICGVVFQNERWRNRCQFSFACDGRSDTPRNPMAWQRAQAVSHIALNGLWSDISGNATHYHATYVQPAWQTSLQKTVAVGRHVFYRDE